MTHLGATPLESLPKQLLATGKAAEFIDMSASWLEHDRLKATPEIPFVKIGSRTVRYHLADLLTFVGNLKAAA